MFKESEKFWRQQEKEFTSKLETARHQMFELEKGKMSLSEGIDYIFISVIKHRGKNILVAVSAFFITFFVLQLLRRFLMAFNVFKLSPKFRFLAGLFIILLTWFAFACFRHMSRMLFITGNSCISAFPHVGQPSKVVG
jgi:hypothetical protein